MTAHAPPSTPIEPLAYRVPDAAVLLGVGQSTVYELIRAGELSSIKFRRVRLVTRAAIDAYLRDRTAA